ncbi:hypothetical protein ACFPRL_02210 [Pseudoclavibacter helvolus]
MGVQVPPRAQVERPGSFLPGLSCFLLQVTAPRSARASSDGAKTRFPRLTHHVVRCRGGKHSAMLACKEAAGA